MKKAKKALALVLCAVLLVAGSVMGTMAYLTSKDEVVNTFTVGKVGITLDEKDVDGSTPNAERDKSNKYSNVMPNHTYEKDPIIHVNADSENAYIFVKVENGLKNLESSDTSYKTVEDQITANGWTQLNDTTGSPVKNVYYKEYTKNQSDKDFEVFEEFKFASNANNHADWEKVNGSDTVAGLQIVVTGYAVQKDGFSDAFDAWRATFGK